MMLIEWWSNIVEILTTAKVTVMESVREGVYNNIFLIQIYLRASCFITNQNQ